MLCFFLLPCCLVTKRITNLLKCKPTKSKKVNGSEVGSERDNCVFSIYIK